jgi:hypothetical protein
MSIRPPGAISDYPWMVHPGRFVSGAWNQSTQFPTRPSAPPVPVPKVLDPPAPMMSESGHPRTAAETAYPHLQHAIARKGKNDPQ